MAKLTLDTIAKYDEISKINNNFDKIEAELQNKVLYRNNPVGEPNTIEGDVDFNNKNVFNVNEVRASDLLIDGVNITASVVASQTAAAASATAAASSASSASSSASAAATSASQAAAAADFIPEIANYAALRAYSGPITEFHLKGYTSVLDGGHGVFRVDTTDTTSADNGGTILVDSSGRRWKREFSGAVNVLWFGADPSNVIDSTTAISSANAAATTLGAYVQFSPGTYKYKPSAKVDIAVGWAGDNDINTIIECDTSAYTGVFFRLTAGEMRNIRVRTVGLTKLGTGIQLAATNIDDFTAHLRLKKVTVSGFSKNIDCHNTYMCTFDQVRSQFGAEGFYCAPADVAGDNGYVTTHVHNNCFYSDNTRNIYYAPPINSYSVVFVGGANQAATGASQQAYFENIQLLNILSWYCEGASAIRAIQLKSCSTMISGLLMNGTGGLSLGSDNNQMELRKVRGLTATDVLHIPTSGSTVKATLDDVSLPTSGNDLAGIDIGTITSSFINNISYSFSAFGTGNVQLKFPATAALSTDPNTLDDYEEGTWTPALSFSTAGDLSVAYSIQLGRYTKVGNTVTAHFWITTSGFTHSTASGAVRITGLPYLATALTNLNPVGALIWQGVTKAGYTAVASYTVDNTQYMEFRASGSGQVVAAVNAADMPTGGTVSLRGTLVYQTAQ